MKRFLILLVCGMVGLAAVALADDGTVTVSGTATVTLEADMAQVTLGVVTAAETVDAASGDNAKAIAALVTALTDAGLAAGDMVTDSYAVNAQYDYQYGKIGETQVITGYQVRNMLRVTVRDVSALGSVIDTAMKAGANECYGVTFCSAQAAAAGDQALEAAIAEAARKAALAAKAAGKHLGDLIALTESPSASQGIAIPLNTTDTTTILADGLSFTATVTMTYEMK